jgi:acid phosphatase
VLYPNDSICRRFAQLSRAYAQRASDRWNDSEDMAYLNKTLGKWMPESSPKIAVDGKPRLSGIMDTINATLAHGPATRLPKEFYDEKARSIIDKIAVDEWFGGYLESQEYRTLGIGALMGDIVSRMVGNAAESNDLGVLEVGGGNGALGVGRGGEQQIRFAMSGCHDTTIAAVLHSLGAMGNEKWPAYTSHIAVELFKKQQASNVQSEVLEGGVRKAESLSTKKGWWSSLFGSGAKTDSGPALRKRVHEMSVAEKEKLSDYFVRLRYNDKIMSVPGCKPAGKHLEGDESFCTLEAFKSIVDKYTPRNWKAECAMNLDQPAIPSEKSVAGFA